MIDGTLDLPRDEDGRIVGYGVGKEAALRDWRHRKEARDFERLVKKLRATKWNREHPERRAEISATHYAKPGVADQQLAGARARRAKAYRANPTIFTCAECGVEWCKAPWVRGVEPRFCGDACRQRARYQAKKPGARRTKRRGHRG